MGVEPADRDPLGPPAQVEGAGLGGGVEVGAAAQEREVVGLNVPVESIFMNHAWLVFNFAFAWGQARRRLGFWPSPLCAVRRFLAGAAAAGGEGLAVSPAGQKAHKVRRGTPAAVTDPT